jgi:hypothetical protein
MFDIQFHLNDGRHVGLEIHEGDFPIGPTYTTFIDGEMQPGYGICIDSEKMCWNAKMLKERVKKRYETAPPANVSQA